MQVPLFPFIFLTLFAGYWLTKNSTDKLEIYIFFTNLFFLALVHFHPQWLIWFLPFFINLLATNLLFRKIFLLSLLPIFTFIFFFDDLFLTWGHFLPLSSSFHLLPSPHNIFINKLNISGFLIQKYSQYVLRLLSLYLLVHCLKHAKK